MQTKHTPGRGFKSDAAARQAFGAIYDAVPKSAFALIAYHLANLCSDEPDVHNSIVSRMLDEAHALVLNGIIPEQHAKAMKSAIAKATGGAA